MPGEEAPGEALGTRVWFNTIDTAPVPPAAKETAKKATWEDVLRNWPLVQADFLTFFHVDLASGILKERPFTWLDTLVKVLVNSPQSRLSQRIRAAR